MSAFPTIRTGPPDLTVPPIRRAGRRPRAVRSCVRPPLWIRALKTGRRGEPRAPGGPCPGSRGLVGRRWALLVPIRPTSRLTPLALARTLPMLSHTGMAFHLQETAKSKLHAMRVDIAAPHGLDPLTARSRFLRETAKTQKDAPRLLIPPALRRHAFCPGQARAKRRARIIAPLPPAAQTLPNDIPSLSYNHATPHPTRLPSSASPSTRLCLRGSARARFLSPLPSIGARLSGP